LGNVTYPKTTETIKITLYYLEHFNHEIHSDNIIFASYYYQFPDKLFKQNNKIVNKALALLEMLFNNKAKDPN
ncbi:36946_t:CDS:2, partial [Gigaspora margarita]